MKPTTPPTLPPRYGSGEWFEWIWDRDLAEALAELLAARDHDRRRILAALVRKSMRGLRLVVDNTARCLAALLPRE